MMFDVCTYQFVKLVVAIHQCIILLVERIEKFLFVTNAEAFLRSVLPCRMQPVAVGNEILVSTFHHVCRPVVSKQDEGVQGTFATVASNDFFFLSSARLLPLKVNILQLFPDESNIDGNCICLRG